MYLYPLSITSFITYLTSAAIEVTAVLRQVMRNNGRNAINVFKAHFNQDRKRLWLHNFKNRFSLQTPYFFVELLGGIYYHSLALVTYASFMAFYVSWLSEKSPTSTKTSGYERAKVLSGFLLFHIFFDAYDKILHPEPLEADKILLIAVIGLAVNA